VVPPLVQVDGGDAPVNTLKATVPVGLVPLASVAVIDVFEIAMFVVPVAGAATDSDGPAFVKYLKDPVEVAMPPVVLMVILTVPATCPGAVTVIEVPLVTVKVGAAVVPNLTDVVPFTNPVPVTVTEVPPVVVPEVGVNEVMVGTVPTKVNWLGVKVEVVAAPPGVMTETMTPPAAWDLVVALMVVELVTWKIAAVVEPNFTAVAPVRFVPEMVTVVLPLVVPDVGVKEVIFGTGATKV
jgi:hypothetical protein